jgi:TRAP-type transport system small permease protein
MAVFIYGMLGKALAKIERIINFAISILLAIIVVINAIEIVSRYLGHGSIYWIHELSILLACWMTFFGIGVVYIKKTDASVALFVNLFGRKVIRSILQVTTTVVVACLMLFIWRAILYLSFQAYPSPSLGIPTSLFSFPVIIGLALIIICLIRDLLAPPQDQVAQPLSWEGTNVGVMVDEVGKSGQNERKS